jgi:MOSC domain-containing protein YiiM
MGRVLSVNLAVPEPNAAKAVGITGINKQPVTGPVLVRAPGPKHGGLGSGLVGDQIFDVANHGGDDHAVYAYAREDYDWWAAHLHRDLAGGLFGENLTTVGVDVNGALIGERWRVGEQLVLQTTFARIPCATFQAKMAEPHWVKRFTEQARPGAYLKVVEPGEVRAGDEVRVVHRPEHGVSIGEFFRAWTLEPELLPRLLTVEELDEESRQHIRDRLSRAPGNSSG